MAESYDGFISYSHAADDLLAPRLQAGLQRFAKPWWRRRAVRVFRDESSLSANPHLWSSITEALDDSEWFVLLLSEDAAQSEWVNREVEYWVTNKDASRILPVVTDGEFGWENGDISVSSTAAPPALSGVFVEEPRWVDLRWARTDEHLDLSNPRFSDAVADIASAIRGVPKDELASEEVRQHRRTIRTAWAAGVVVLLLGVAATVGAIVAVGQSNEAQDQRDEAQRQAQIASENEERALTAEADALQLAEDEAEARDLADANAEAAEANAQETERQRQIAEDSAEEADRSAVEARARELAANAVTVADDDAQLSLLLALTAIDLLPAGAELGPAIETALRTAMAADRLVARYDAHAEPGPSQIDLSPDGKRVVFTSAASRRVELLDAESLEPIWSQSLDIPDLPLWVSFSSKGSFVVVSLADESWEEFRPWAGEPAGEPDAGFLVLDSTDGTVVHTERIPGSCKADVVPGGFREDLSLIGFGFEGCGDRVQPGTIRFLETVGWTEVYERAAGNEAHVIFADDSSLAAVFTGFNSGTDSWLLDTETWEEIRALDYAWGDLSPDGSLLAGATFDSVTGVVLETAVEGEVIDRFTEDLVFPWDPRFSPDGRRLAYVTFGNTAYVYDPGTGERLEAISTGPSERAAFDGNLLYTVWDGVVSKWDASGILSGDLDTDPLGLWVNGNSIFWARDTIVAHVSDRAIGSWYYYPVDAQGRLGDRIEATDVWWHTVLSEGRMAVFRGRETEPDLIELGPLEVVDLASGTYTVVAGCWMEEKAAFRHEPCPDGTPHPGGQLSTVGSRDGDEFVIFDFLQPDEVSNETFAVIWDAQTLTVEDRLSLGVLDAPFNTLGRSALTDEYIVVLNRNGQQLRLFDRSTGTEIPFDQGRAEPVGLEHDRVQNRLWITNQGEAVWLLDLDDLTVRQVTEPQPGTIRALASSPSGDLIAVGSFDGNLRIFTEGGEPVHVIPIKNPSDAWWLDETHLVVGTGNGPWTTITLDEDELTAIARSRVRRAFTVGECDFYNLVPCPTLDEINSRG